MPEREPLRGADACELAERWAVDQGTIARLVVSAGDYFEETRHEVQIISGYRTALEQARLARTGRPAAPDNLSTHRTCPATGVDISLGFGATRVMKAIWGRIVNMNGLRWGGGGSVDSGGIPLDWQHVDRGPRMVA